MSTPFCATARKASELPSPAAGNAAWRTPPSELPTRTIQQSPPPFWNQPYTLWARYAPSMNGPFSGFWASPKIVANCVQFAIRVGRFTGPPGARPTNAAIDVPTPSIGLFAEGTSSTYTPGVK